MFRSVVVCKGNFGKRKLGEGEPKQPSRSQRSIPEGVVDRFGAVNVLSTDKFGALRSLEESGDDVYDTSEEHSTGSCTPVEYNTQRRKHGHTGVDPAWRLTSPGGLENQGASSCPSDPGSNSSIPISCTLHESRTPTRSDAGAPVKQFWPPPLDKHPVSALNTSILSILCFPNSRTLKKSFFPPKMYQLGVTRWIRARAFTVWSALCKWLSRVKWG